LSGVIFKAGGASEGSFAENWDPMNRSLTQTSSGSKMDSLVTLGLGDALLPNASNDLKSANFSQPTGKTASTASPTLSSKMITSTTTPTTKEPNQLFKCIANVFHKNCNILISTVSSF
jgi:hypothetical protein